MLSKLISKLEEETNSHFVQREIVVISRLAGAMLKRKIFE